MKCDCIEKLAAILRDEAALWHAADDRNLARAFTVVADRLTAPPAEAARGGPGEANPNLSPSTVRALRHGMNCSGRAGDESGCTCGLLWRDQLETERTMHAAWRKRAEEAESALAAREAEVGRFREALERIGCDWVGLGSCPRECGLPHAAEFPCSSEDMIRDFARAALTPPTNHGAPDHEV